MKTRTLFLFTAFAACTFCACSDDSTQDITGEIPEIKLTAPENGVTFDLQGKKGITFQWEKAKGISVYKLALSLSEDMSNPKTIKITGSTDVLNAYQLDLDARITALGIEDFTEGARIYWTIRPANDAVKAQSEVRYFTAYRLPVVIPGRPSGGEYVDANEFTDNKYPFSWVKIENANAYTLKISTSRNFPENDTYTEEVGDTDHFDFTSAAAETFFANMGLQPDQLNHITFYWTVLPNPASERYTAAVDSFYAIRKGAGATELVKTDWTVNVLNTYSGAAADIIDGDEATWWNSNGNTTSWIAWAEIDMQKLKMIKSIRIACSHSVKYGYLYASETQPGSWPGDAPLIGTIVRETTNWETLFYWDIPLGAPINAQYLYLYLSDSHQYGYHLIYEVYLNGYSE